MTTGHQGDNFEWTARARRIGCHRWQPIVIRRRLGTGERHAVILPEIALTRGGALLAALRETERRGMLDCVTTLAYRAKKR